MMFVLTDIILRKDGNVVAQLSIVHSFSKEGKEIRDCLPEWSASVYDISDQSLCDFVKKKHPLALVMTLTEFNQRF